MRLGCDFVFWFYSTGGAGREIQEGWRRERIRESRIGDFKLKLVCDTEWSRERITLGSETSTLT